MTADPFADVERETLHDASGRPVLRFLRTTRDGLPAADLVVAEDGVDDDELAAAALAAFPGWAFSGSASLGRLLLGRGATTIRHAHVMSRDLRTDPADPAWATSEPPDGLSVRLAPTEPRDYLELIEAAYPPGHADHVPRSEEERLAHDVVPLLDGSLGPVLAASGVVVDGDGRMVALCLVTDMDTNGPWVVDVARLPDLRYAGLGALLLQRALGILTSDGADRLGLAVTEGNPARRTYERLGFVEVLESLTVRLPTTAP